ncbi:MAG: hypothetical protein U9O82_08820 [Thermodesulfobacteriota bacterium]|nr:hypothetical protein [Thermodesulfobacteriota bacterium]
MSRSQAYIGVLIDDLMTRGTKEPYRLFTSRAEYRLLLREDNADLRLRDIGRDLGLVDRETYAAFKKKRDDIDQGVDRLNKTMVRPTHEINSRLEASGSVPLKQAIVVADLLRRPEIKLHHLAALIGKDLEIQPEVTQEVELQVKYEGYIKRQNEQVERFKRVETVALPEELKYEEMAGLSTEIVEKLSQIRPGSLGQASRISGVTPAAISVLQVHLKKAGLF